MFHAKRMGRVAGIILAVFLIMGCASSGNTSATGSSDSESSVNVNNSSLTLADYLRKEPAITIQGTGDNIRVFVRGVSTAKGNNQPLFVVDGNRAGRSYQDVVRMVDVNDIENIRVLRGTDAGSRYGLQGSGGVIEIRTKRD